MSIVQTEAIVLKKRDYSESSLLVDFFTRDFGKVKSIIKGAKRNKTNITGDLAIFSYNHIVFYESRHSDINKLTQCQLLDRFDSIRTDIAGIAIASYFIELVDSLSSPQDPSPQIFDILLWSLKSLKDNMNPQIISIIFQIKLLHLSGILPDLKRCCVCKTESASKNLFFSILLGGALCKNCADDEPSGIKISEGVLGTMESLSNITPKEKMRFDINEGVQNELDGMLNEIFKFHIDRNLKSLDFLNKVH
ncbi:MAG: DNA repair protein RecO [Candidatus Omnitrophica bacterium]|nr:DNA repair protein RecO [Candidatus Omnitrophota bacterium]